MKIKNYLPTQSKFQVSYNDIIPKNEIEYIRDLRIAYILGCYRLSHQATTHSVGFCFCFIFWIYKICCGWVVNFLCDLL
jgi:hypothetical protein